MKRFVVALLVSGACVGANAATTDLGPINFAQPTQFTGSLIPAGTFNDIFTFILPVNGGSGYSVLNIPLTIPGGGTFNTVLSTMSVVSNPDGILFTPDDTVVASVATPGNLLSLTLGPTAGGSMYLNITGITNGTSGGLYSGAIGAVPEAETWAMMAMGLGLVGLQLRRKARSSNKLATD